jgi:starch phosphorylase
MATRRTGTGRSFGGKTTTTGGDGTPVIQVEDDRTSLEPAALKRAILDNLYYLEAKDEITATPHDWYMALAYTVRDRLIRRWICTQRCYYQHDAKRVYYLSAEYLLGRSLGNNLLSLGIFDSVRAVLKDLGVDLETLLEIEPDAGLGNGGLGRLAACFMDSLATLSYPAICYGLRYEYGIFRQEIRQGYQVETADQWLRFGNPWEIPRPEYIQRVQFGGHTESYIDEKGRFRVRWVGTRDLLGLPYDTPVPGYRTDTVNTLRLWQSRAVHEFDFDEFNRGDYADAVGEKVLWENLSKVLYPNDDSMQGKELRLKQQYFFVSCSVKDILRRYLKTHKDFGDFVHDVAIQLNDTHPTLAIPELLRLLLDEHGMPWEEAWTIVENTFGYTNHTLLAEALEKWPVEMMERLLPRHLELIYEINRRFLEQVGRRFPGDGGLLSRVSLIQENPRMVRMAHLAVVGSHSVNGVAELHTELLKSTVMPDFAAIWPEKFNSKTNGVTPRRFVRLANPELSAFIDEVLGSDAWVTNLDLLQGLEQVADDPAALERFRRIKRDNKASLARYIKAKMRLDVDLDSMFDVQIKRFHEYKRQHLNALHIIHLYARLKKGEKPIVPRTFIFGGKAAPGYFMAKLIIKLINSVASVCNSDPHVAPWLKVVFLENYGVSLAEKIIPAADLSEQISTAGKEASGTGNMKFALNGALTIGTLDGANVEIRQCVGDDNFFLFGLTAPQVLDLKQRGYDPYGYYRDDPDLREALDLIADNHFTPHEPGVLRPLLDNLLGSDPYLVLADFRAYVEAQKRAAQAYTDPGDWSRRALLNVARCGMFSSDRTIRQYAQEIWHLEPVKVEVPRYVQT